MTKRRPALHNTLFFYICIWKENCRNRSRAKEDVAVAIMVEKSHKGMKRTMEQNRGESIELPD